MKALLQTSSSERVPTPPEKRFLINGKGILAVCLVVAALSGMLMYAARRPPRPLIGSAERQVEDWAEFVRREERWSGGGSSLRRLLESLPAPLSHLSDLGSSNRDYDAIERTARLVTAIGSSAVPPLAMRLASDPSPRVREGAAEILGDIADPAAILPLTSALRGDTDGEVRREAAEALGTIRDPAAIPALSGVLAGDPAADVRAAAAKALGRIGEASALSPLLAALRDEKDADVRASAALSLGRIGSPNAAPGLAAALEKDGDGGVRQAAAEALGACPDDVSVSALLAALARAEDPVTAGRAASALGRIGNRRAAPALLEAFAVPSRDLCIRAAVALSEIGEPGTASPLMARMAYEGDADVREGIAKALGFLGDPAALPVLQKALADTASDVRYEAAWALGHLGDPAAVPPLSALLKDRESRVRFAAAFALAELRDPSAVPALKANLSDRDGDSRTATACALALLGHTEGVSVLSRAVRSDAEWERFAASVALLRLATPAANELLGTRLTDEKAAIRDLARGALDGEGTMALAAVLRDRDDDFRQYAALALAFFDDPAVLPALRDATTDCDPEVRTAARWVTRRIERLRPAGEPKTGAM